MHEKNKPYYFGITGNIKQRIDDYRDQKLKVEGHDNPIMVFIRKFPDTLTAVGYKMVLKKLSNESVMLLIKRANPEMVNYLTEYI